MHLEDSLILRLLYFSVTNDFFNNERKNPIQYEHQVSCVGYSITFFQKIDFWKIVGTV